MSKYKPFEMTAEEREVLDSVLIASGSERKEESLANVRELAKALETPLRKGVLSGDILGNIFQVQTLAPGTSSEWPLDLLAPGTEKNHIAYTIPNQGYIPQRNVEGDYLTIPQYDIGNAIDWNLKYAREAKWGVIQRAAEVFRAGFTKKLNDDGFHTLIGAAADRNIVVVDSNAQKGAFTTRLVSLLTVVMRRNGGGNSTSMNRGKLTDLYVSPEAVENMRSWRVDQIDPVTQRQIFVAPGDQALSAIYGVNIHSLDELGEGQEYQLYFTSELGGTMPTNDVEIVLGLDLSKNDSFIMPVSQQLEIYEDDALHRQRRAGIYGWMQQGFACLDGRRAILGSF